MGNEFCATQVFFLEYLYITVNSFKQFCHSSVSRTWFLSWVATNSVLKVHWMNIIWEVVSPFKRTHSAVRILILRNCVVFAGPNFDDFHLVQCKGSCFVWANVISTTHDFARRKTFNIIVVLKHTWDWISKWDHNSKRETFWHCDNNYCNTDYDVANPFWKSIYKKFSLFNTRVLTAEEISVTLCHAL